MTKMMLTANMLSVLVACLLFTPSASAQTEFFTYVSVTGTDSNNCTYAAPCRTIATAVTKTLAGGEVNVLNAGNYEGHIDITKSIRINGNNLATIYSPNIGPYFSIKIAAGSLDVVRLRGLSIVSTVHNGIEYLSGQQVYVEDCSISSVGMGVKMEVSAGANLVIRNTTIQGQGTSDRGIKVSSSSTTELMNVALENVRITGRSTGLEVVNGTVSVSNSSITQNTTGIINGGGVLDVENSNIVSNSWAGLYTTYGRNRLSNVSLMNGAFGLYANTGSRTVLSDVKVMNNATGIKIEPGATVASFGNNKIADNGSTTPPNENISQQ